MSEATVKALNDAIYDALEGSDPVRELDNEQVYEVARLAAQTIETAGATKAIIRAWLEENEVYPLAAEWLAEVASRETRPTLWAIMRRLANAIREVSS